MQMEESCRRDLLCAPAVPFAHCSLLFGCVNSLSVWIAFVCLCVCVCACVCVCRICVCVCLVWLDVPPAARRARPGSEGEMRDGSAGAIMQPGMQQYCRCIV